MKLFLRVPKTLGMVVGFRDSKTGKVNAGYKLFLEKCDIDIPDDHGKQMLEQNGHIVSLKPKDLAPHLRAAEQAKVDEAIKVLVKAGYKVIAPEAGFVPEVYGGTEKTDTTKPVSNDEALKALEEMEKLDLTALKKAELAPWAEKLGLKVGKNDTVAIITEKIAERSRELLG